MLSVLAFSGGGGGGGGAAILKSHIKGSNSENP